MIAMSHLTCRVTVTRCNKCQCHWTTRQQFFNLPELSYIIIHPFMQNYSGPNLAPVGWPYLALHPVFTLSAQKSGLVGVVSHSVQPFTTLDIHVFVATPPTFSFKKVKCLNHKHDMLLTDRCKPSKTCTSTSHPVQALFQLTQHRHSALTAIA